MARKKVNHELLSDCLKILETTGESAKSVIGIYEKEKGKKRGSPTDQEQDLLRAALLLLCAGLDSFLKQLVEDCVENIRKKDKKSRQYFTSKAAELLKIKETKDLNYQIVANALLSGDPEQYVVGRVKGMISEHSLQSYGELQNVLRAFGFDENMFAPEKDLIRDMFNARNSIVHNYDYAFSQNRSAGLKHRIQRTKEDIQKYIDLLMKMMNTLYARVNQTLLQEK